MVTLTKSGIQNSEFFQAPWLRVMVSLSHLLKKRGKKETAKTILAEIYGWFTEGFDTADLKEAKRLPEELRES